ncbi:MAG: hypothetical protein HZA53_05490 [Planctomycetes bacterium]|nr:hypothetical protein [Planctomycetota bacterium]
MPPTKHPTEARRPRPRLVELLVVLVWAALVVHADFYVAHFGSPVASRDDLELLLAFEPQAGFTDIARHFWNPLNEHRIPLSQWIHFGAVSWSNDFRAGGHVQVGLLALTALAGILTVRRLRGRTCVEDVLFPLLLLHWSNGENLLLGTQICVALALFLTTIAGCACAWAPGAPSARRISVVGACLLLLPWCGGFGLCPSPAIAAWIAVAAWRARREGRVRDGWLAAGVLLAYAACLALYFHDLAWPERPPFERRLDVGAGIVAQVLSMTFGGIAPFEPWSAIPAALVLLGVATGYGVAGLRRGGEQGWRGFGVVVIVAGVLLLALSIAWARQNDWPYAGWAPRYALAPSPLAFAAVFAVVSLGGKLVARAFPIALALLLAAAMPLHVERGRWMAEQAELILRPFLNSVASDMTIDELARTYAGWLYADEDGLRARLVAMREARLPPYDHLVDGPAVEASKLVERPIVLEAAATREDRVLAGLEVIGVAAPARLCVALREDARFAAGRVGVLPIAYVRDTPDEAHTLGVRCRIVQEREGRGPLELLRRDFRPLEFKSDRGLHAFQVELAPGGGRLLLLVESLTNERPGTDWLGWTRLEVR